jgi:hypothetical protein
MKTTQIDKNEIKRLAIRAGITFIQSAVAVWAVSSEPFTIVALAGAVGAGLSVVYNTVIQPYLNETTSGV